MTSWHGNISELLALCEGIHRSPVEFPHKWPVLWRYAVDFGCTNSWTSSRVAGYVKRLSAHLHCNDVTMRGQVRAKVKCKRYVNIRNLAVGYVPMIMHKVHDLWRFVLDYIAWYYPYISWLRHYQLSRHKRCSCVIQTRNLQADWFLESIDWYYNFDKWEHNKTMYVLMRCTVKYEYIHTLGRVVEQDSIAGTCVVSTFHLFTNCLGESDPLTFKHTWYKRDIKPSIPCHSIHTPRIPWGVLDVIILLLVIVAIRRVEIILLLVVVGIHLVL